MKWENIGTKLLDTMVLWTAIALGLMFWILVAWFICSCLWHVLEPRADLFR